MDKKQERLKLAQQHAESKGGKCLSEDYVNTNTKMKWKCSNPEHDPWLASHNTVVIRNRWCHKCAGHLEPQEYLFKAQEYAKYKDGECLTEDYVNTKTKMLWKCKEENHKQFEMIFHNAVRLKRWCPECQKESYHIKDSEKTLNDYAKSRHGTVVLIGSPIINSKTYITFKCNNKEHKPWKVTYRNVTKFQTWCPECAGRFTPEENIEKAKKYAISHGGYYVSGEYKNQDSKLTFKCGNQNHKPWSVSFDKIIPLKTWCKECAADKNRKEQLERAHEHAVSKRGKCLSNTYLNANKKLLWQCEKGHKPWEAKFSNVINNNRWCPECAGHLTPEEFLDKAKQHALSRGGECLSKNYISSLKKLSWNCGINSHKSWFATYPNVVIQNTWCPECKDSINIRENYTRIILEELLGFSLKSSFPEWNINPKTKRKLQLDGYNKEHNFAFEFQGRQHYEEKTIFSDSLESIQFRDKVKKENCKKEGVFLLIVNYISKIKTPEKMIDYISSLLIENNISYVLNKEKIIGRINNLYVTNHGFLKYIK